MKEIPLLTAADIECRVGQVGAGKTGKVHTSLLLYKDARVDMRILDDVFGVMGWQREHDLITGNLFCSILIWDDDKKQWIRKQDVGTESNTEKEKGQASDSFKRAGVNVGIGRELYTAPKISVELSESEYSVDKDKPNDKPKIKPYVRFHVKEIQYNDRREVSYLTIYDNQNKGRFIWPKV